MNLIETMKQALEALEEAEVLCKKLMVAPLGKVTGSITNLRAAIAEMEKAEPVAWLYVDPYNTLKVSRLLPRESGCFPVFAHPAPALPVAWMSPDGKVSTTKGVVFRTPLYPAPAVSEGEK